MFRLGYNTNGLAHHRLRDALDLVAQLGYEGVALTPDVGELDLFDLDAQRVRDLRRRAEDLGLALVIETGARFVLDPRRKHRPNLLDAGAADRERRVDFYRRSIDLAVELGAPLVSLWSGAAEDGSIGDAPMSPRRAGFRVALSAQPESSDSDAARFRDPPTEILWERLVDGISKVLDHARDRGVRIGFEPEPGMFVERPAGYIELVQRLGRRGDDLGLTLDLGHLVVTGDVPPGPVVRSLRAQLVHVHLDDARFGVHEHLQLGSGELDLVDALKALLETSYAGMAAVELSRDSHRAPETALQALERIRSALRT